MVYIKIKKINSVIVRIDKLRARLIRDENLEGFLSTYTPTNDVKNFNTGTYWSQIFQNTGGIFSQSPMTQDKISTLANCIPHTPISILDLGIGQAFLEELLIKRNVNYKLEGIDISPLAIERAKKRFKGKYIVGDVLKIGKFYKKNSFDVIAAIELLEHISPSGLFAFYKQIYDILKKDGRFILSIPINENLQLMNTNPSAHVRDYTLPIIKIELETNGFMIEKKSFLFAFNKNYLIKKFLARIWINRWKPNCLIIIAKKSNII